MLLFETGKRLEQAFPAEQFAALVEVFDKRGDRSATKEDLQETELRTRVEIEKVRAEVKEVEARLSIEIEKVRAEVKEVEARLSVKIEKVKYDLLKWQIGGWVALAAIMAKGFGWLGFYPSTASTIEAAFGAAFSFAFGQGFAHSSV